MNSGVTMTDICLKDLTIGILYTDLLQNLGF